VCLTDLVDFLYQLDFQPYVLFQDALATGDTQLGCPLSPWRLLTPGPYQFSRVASGKTLLFYLGGLVLISFVLCGVLVPFWYSKNVFFSFSYFLSPWLSPD
jgi:hypothetical protein